MRKCIRCGSEMKENCAIKIEGGGYGIVLSSDENKLFGGRMGKPKVAICPECGDEHDFDYPRCPRCKYDYYK